MKVLIQTVRNTGLVTLALMTAVIMGARQPAVAQDLKPAVAKVVQVWNTGKVAELDAVVDAKYVRHADAATSLEGLDALKELVTTFRTAYPDLKLVLDDAIYAGDKAVVRWSFTGTNTGPGEMPPTGKAVNVWGISIVHFANGKAVEEWIGFDNQSMMEQLGFTMTPPSSDMKK